MGNGLRSFAARYRAYADDIPKQVNEIKKETVREIVTTVVPATPVATGQARSNYYTTSGNADTATVAHGPFTKNGDQSLTRMASAIQRFKPKVPVFVTNNLPYIGRLNDGYSTQAPAGFVELAVAKANALIRRQTVRFGGRKSNG